MMSLFLLLSVLLWPSLGVAAIAVVQSVSATGNGVSSLTTGNITTTTGNLVICDAAFYSTGNFTGITDSEANSYNIAVSETASSADSFSRGLQQYAANITGGVNHNFTISFDTSDNYISLACKEISGALTSGVLDQTSINIDNSGSTGLTSNATATTAQNDELLAGGAACPGGNTPPTTFTALGGFTENEEISCEETLNIGLLSASRVVTVTGSYAFTFSVSEAITAGGMGWIATYRAAVTGAPVASKRRIVIQP